MIITLETDLDTIILMDRYESPRHAWGIRRDGVKGLFGTPAYRESFEAMPQMDGEYWPSRLTQQARDITLDCVIRECSSVSAAEARRRINNLWGRRITLRVQDSFGSRHLQCALANDPEPTMYWRAGDGFTFSLVLHAPDPLLYGADHAYTSPNGLLAVDNTGDVPTWPVVSSTNATRIALTLDGHRVAWTGDAKPLSLDFRDMLPSQGTVSYDDAFRVPPGRSLIRVDADATVTISIRQAWR